jgi:hypothetical protein
MTPITRHYARYRYACEGCEDTVFYYENRPSEGETLSPHYATLPDGTKPEAGKYVKCPSCGRHQRLYMNFLEGVDDAS